MQSDQGEHDFRGLVLIYEKQSRMVGIMTVTTIRDGIIAADSLVSSGGVGIGFHNKITTVPEIHGGGFIAHAGELGAGIAAVTEFCQSGNISEPEDVTIVHLRGDGSVWGVTGSGWYQFQCEFTAFGSAWKIAHGAMLAGADAKTACEIAIGACDGCGGDVQVESVVRKGD